MTLLQLLLASLTLSVQGLKHDCNYGVPDHQALEFINHVNESLTEEPRFTEFRDPEWQCQRQCFLGVMYNAAKIIAFKGALDHLHSIPDSEAMIMTQSVWGALSACYPSKPRTDLLRYARNVFKKLDHPQTLADSDILHRIKEKAASCHHRNTRLRTEKDGLRFMHLTLLDAVDRVIRDKSSVPHHLTEYLPIDAMMCQMECMRTSVPALAVGLFFSHTFTDQESFLKREEQAIVNGTAGFLKTCFPGADWNHMVTWAYMIYQNMEAAQKSVGALRKVRKPDPNTTIESRSFVV